MFTRAHFAYWPGFIFSHHENEKRASENMKNPCVPSVWRLTALAMMKKRQVSPHLHLNLIKKTLNPGENRKFKNYKQLTLAVVFMLALLNSQAEMKNCWSDVGHVLGATKRL